MKKILMLLFANLIFATSNAGEVIEEVPVSIVKKGTGHRIVIYDLDCNKKLLLPDATCIIQIVVKDSFGNIVDCEERTLLASGNTIIIPNEYLDDNCSVEIYQDNTLIYNSKTENSELFF